MPVYAGHEAQADCATYRLCDLALVLRSQACFLRMLYAARLGHVFGHDGEVLRLVSVSVQASPGLVAHLVLCDGVDAEGVEGVAGRGLAGRLPLLLLDAR